MITAKQAEARRRNGRLSRGPKTPEGKAISSRNAVKFGFYANSPSDSFYHGSPVLPEAGETQQEFAAFEQGLLKSLAPVGPAETRLARQIVNARWTQRRCPAIEAAIYNAAIRSDVRAQSRRRAWIRKWISDNGQQLSAQAAAALEASTDPAYTVGRAFIRDCRGPRNFDRLFRFENRADRQADRGMKELRKLQKVRFSQNEPTNSAIFLQVNRLA